MKICPVTTPFSFKIADVDESKLAGDWTSTTPNVVADPSGDAFWTGVKVTISNVDTTAHTFGWSASRDGKALGVDAVIVKGEYGAAVYAYKPEASSASGLHAPKVDNKKKRYQRIRSITLCLDEDVKPPPKTTTVTTTTPGQTVTQTVTTTVTNTVNNTVTTTAPRQEVAPTKTTGTTPAKKTTPKKTTPRRGNATARLSPGCLRKRSITVTVRGTAMRRITLRRNGRTVKRINVRSGRRSVRTTLRTGGGRVQRITAIVQFRGNRTSRTLRVTGLRCVPRNPSPLFTG